MLVLISLIFIILIVFLSTVRGDTYAEGDISTDTTWTEKDSPYIVINNIHINSAATLEIKPGVIVKFGAYFNISIEGNLIAKGQVDNEIIFTSNKLDSSMGDWYGIEILKSEENDDIQFEYCQFEYSNNGILSRSERKLQIRNCKFKENGYSIQYLSSGIIEIEGCEFRNNTYGTYLFGEARLTIRSSIFENNWNAIYLLNSDIIRFLTISDNKIFGNYEDGIFLQTNDDGHSQIGQFDIKNNEIFDNQGDGINIAVESRFYSQVYNSNFEGNEIYRNERKGINITIHTKTKDSYNPGSYEAIINGINFNGNIIHSNNGDGVGLTALMTDEYEGRSGRIEVKFIDLHFLENEIFSNNGYGVLLTLNSDANLADCDVLFDLCVITENRIIGNQDGGVYLHSNARNSRTGCDADASSIISNITISSNDINVNGGKGLFIHSEAESRTLDSCNGHQQSYSHSEISHIQISNNNILGNSGSGISIYVYEECYLKYSSSATCNPSLVVVDLRINDNLIASNDAHGIWLSATNAVGTLDINVNVERNEIFSNLNGIIIWGLPVLFKDNSIGYNINGGISITGSPEKSIAKFNDIFYNGYGVNIDADSNINAEENYWGHDSGPYHISLNPDGKGNSVNGNGTNLDFIPYLSSSNDNIPSLPSATLSHNSNDYQTLTNITFHGSSQSSEVEIKYYRFISL